MHFNESILIDTTDGMQCKAYANQHPDGKIIVKPKYIPSHLLEGEGLKYRFLFEQKMVRFNLFAKKDKLKVVLENFRKQFPDYIHQSDDHDNWFFVVPENKIKTIHDPKKGVKQLMSMPKKDLDDYLTLTTDLIELILQSGVTLEDIGITHSTLLGNYTPGKSDIDLIIFGKENAWKVQNFLATAQHPKLRWKTEAEWKEYYLEHKTSESSHFTEDEYAKHLARKYYEGMFGETVFTLFSVENEDEVWCKWGSEKYEPQGVVTIKGKVTDHYNSIVRPGFYELDPASIQMINNETGKELPTPLPITKVVTYSIPFILQAKKGETLEACGLLEKVTPKEGNEDGSKNYYRIVVGYFDAYTSDRREKEYLKAEIV